jgi:hypothetical protein
MKISLELDQEILDKALVKMLQEDYKSLRKYIKQLRKKDYLEHYEQGDLQDHIKHAGAIGVALQYYMPMSEYTEFINNH